MFSEMAIGYGDSSRSLNSINQSIHTIRHGNMIDPNVGGSEDGNPIAVASGTKAVMVYRVSDHATIARLNVTNVNTMYDDIVYELQSDACAVGDVDFPTPAVDRLSAGQDQLLGEPNYHGVAEDDPERLLLDDGVAEGSGLRIHEIVIGGIRDGVYLPSFSSDGVAAEAQRAVGELHPVLGPVFPASPALINGVCCHAWTFVLIGFA